LSNIEGDLRSGSAEILSKNDSTLVKFCNASKEHYLRRLEFLNNYSKKNSIAPNIQKMAESEIYCSYIHNLIAPLLRGKLGIDSYPKEYADLIRTSKFNNPDLYFKTSQYQLLAYDFCRIKNTGSIVAPSFSKEQLISGYQWIKKNDEEKIRNHQITVQLHQYINQYNTYSKYIDSLYKDFKKYSPSQSYIAFLDSDIVVNKNKEIPVYTINQAMSTEMKDSVNHKKNVQSLLSKKPVLIICWASWCKPCIAQIPYESKLEKIYGDKIDFIYLSFDKSESQWRSKSNELKINKNNYLLLNNFKSDMASYYKINSIPRFMVYDKKGKLMESNTFRPSDKEFKTILDGLIN